MPRAGDAPTPVPRHLQVTAVLVTPDGDIVSAALDKSIRVWRGGQCVQVLEGHEAAVLCLLQLPNGDLLSGSGDCTIKVWSGGKCTHTIAAHSDSVRWAAGGGCSSTVSLGVGFMVQGRWRQHAARLIGLPCCLPAGRRGWRAYRGLALLPGVGVVSASHDQTLKVWTFSGECIAELVGHTSLVYCDAATPDGLVASGSEDNTAKLWHADGTCLQVGRKGWGRVWACRWWSRAGAGAGSAAACAAWAGPSAAATCWHHWCAPHRACCAGRFPYPAAVCCRPLSTPATCGAWPSCPTATL